LVIFQRQIAGVTSIYGHEGAAYKVDHEWMRYQKRKGISRILIMVHNFRGVGPAQLHAPHKH
jgi:hypothetical protein